MTQLLRRNVGEEGARQVVHVRLVQVAASLGVEQLEHVLRALPSQLPVVSERSAEIWGSAGLIGPAGALERILRHPQCSRIKHLTGFK